MMLASAEPCAPLRSSARRPGERQAMQSDHVQQGQQRRQSQNCRVARILHRVRKVVLGAVSACCSRPVSSTGTNSDVLLASSSPSPSWRGGSGAPNQSPGCASQPSAGAATSGGTAVAPNCSPCRGRAMRGDPPRLGAGSHQLRPGNRPSVRQPPLPVVVVQTRTHRDLGLGTPRSALFRSATLPTTAH